MGLNIPLVAEGQPVGASQGREKGAFLFSPQGMETIHFTRSRS